MNSATTTLVNGSETVTFTTTEGSTKVAYRSSRGDYGTMSRRAALVEMSSLRADGWVPGR